MKRERPRFATGTGPGKSYIGTLKFAQKTPGGPEMAMSDEISATELSEILEREPSTPLIDVREQEEFDEVNLAGKLIPMSELEGRWQEIPKEGTVYIHCRSGKRSRTAIEFLKSKGYGNCVNVTGGILAWLNEVNPEGRSA